ncbi:PAS domain S-box-containing protein [Maribacter caenipelagi]|uniref:histidine kinase n=1 Tax=Maribacter caenipelagi TaxID=1447781 RepID=A0A4R7D9X0_9FLAO|nr:PAS domain-containing sensor histidine kinase [Maribacter caenipelagi]TDS16835.1 PAS domain S-box-containing protein [Maribacter caenipelagi]
MTELKKIVNKKLEVSDTALYQAVFDSSLASLFVIDGKGTILKVNDQVKQMFGYQKSDLILEKIDIIFSKGNYKTIELLMKNSISEHVQLTGLHKNRKEYELDVRLVKTSAEGQTIFVMFCKQVDISVFESDRKLRYLIANVPGIVFRCATDEDYSIEFISNACTTITEYLPEQFYDSGNMSWLSLIHFEDQVMVKEQRRKAISEEKTYQISYRIKTRTNQIKWVSEIVSCVKDWSGKVAFLEGFIQDVTERTEAKMLLTKEKQLLWKYLDTSASVFLVINKDHTIEMVNRKGCEVFGYSAQELNGKNWFNICIPKEDRNHLAQFFDDLINGDEEILDVKENWVLTKGNIKKLIRWQNALSKDENGEVTGMISSGIDVTEKVLAEKRLHTSMEKNRAILKVVPDVMTVHDENGSVLEIHIPADANTILSKEDIEGKDLDQLLPLKIAKKLKKAITRVLQNKKMQILEIQVPINHRIFDFECRVVRLNNNQVLTIARNISNTKAIQKTLHLRNKSLDAAGNGIIIVDAQKANLPIIYCNNAFIEITGYDREEVIGTNCKFLQNDDRNQEAIVVMVNAIEKREATRVLIRNYRKDGTLFWNDLSITPLFDENNILTHFIGVQNDVTEIQRDKNQLEQYANSLEEKVAERTKEIESTVQKLVENNLILEDQIYETKLAERKAQSSQAQLIAIAENFPNGFIAVFNSDFELVFIEGEELKRMKIKKSTFEGKKVDHISVFSERQANAIKRKISTTFSGNSLSFEFTFDGLIYAVNTTPLKSDNGQVVWALFVYNNITQQKKVQEKLTKALKVEQELNELKSRFISIASHEFRTPLSAILSSAILIGKQNEPGLEDKRQKHVTRIRTHVKRLVVILNDFLSLSRLEEGKLAAKTTFFELIKFCKNLIDEMESAKKDEQSIHFIHTEAEIMAFLDPKLLSHILINLLSNSLKYSDEGKAVTLEIKRNNTLIEFNIIDNGIGIEVKEQKRLFERFFRAENATHIQGTGLGLHIVKQYAELMGGTVSFKSEFGIGSTFTVQLNLNHNLYKYEKDFINRR